MAQTEKQRLIIIAGPTAVGKSGAAVRLAKEIGGEVISADDGGSAPSSHRRHRAL